MKDTSAFVNIPTDKLELNMDSITHAVSYNFF